ncbi:hypothetical protein H0H81_009574 [Sphagnurus paluster]|uniref:Uncharacterized protein n=1 Tax=Sphagnurus paluster TaxID=117069 RepID=A0A9P7FPK6_9AGAR|nr:hypothetical protein H0H81_009574 [Sphagnurus paluster]
MSIPLLISQTRPENTYWALKSPMYARIFYGICVALNLFVSGAIAARIYLMRQKVKQVMGELHANFYTGFVTILVESGALFTLWGLVYVIMLAGDIVEKETFLLPYTQILGITRMLIILRMAQDRAWSLQLAQAIASEASEWQPTSTHNIPLHDVPASSEGSPQKKCRESKYRESQFHDSVSLSL